MEDGDGECREYRSYFRSCFRRSCLRDASSIGFSTVRALFSPFPRSRQKSRGVYAGKSRIRETDARVIRRHSKLKCIPQSRSRPHGGNFQPSLTRDPPLSFLRIFNRRRVSFFSFRTFIVRFITGFSVLVSSIFYLCFPSRL